MGRIPTYTVADVVQMAQVTERTVRRDVASGVLPSLKLPNGRLRFRRADIEAYRCSRVLLKPHMKLVEVARLYGVTVRSLRRNVAKGNFPVPIIRASRRRHYVSRSAFERWAGGRDVVDALERIAMQREQGSGAEKPQQPPGASTEPSAHFPRWLLIHEVAALAGKTVRQVYHDLEKGALNALQMSRGGRILVRTEVAEAYAGRSWPPKP